MAESTSSTEGAGDVRFLDITVNHEDLEQGTYDVLKVLREDWRKEDVKRKYIDENSARANRTYMCYVTDDFDDAVVFRVGTDLFQQFVNREVSLKCFMLFNEVGVAPNLLCRLPNGLCCEYIKGSIFSRHHQEKLKDLNIAKNVAMELAKIHAKKTTQLAAEKYDMTPENTPWTIFDVVLKNWPEKYTDPESQQIYTSPEFPTKEAYLKEKAILEEHIATIGDGFRLCHNDSGLGNVIYNEEKDFAVLIDYDICGYNYQCFDLALYTVGTASGFPGKYQQDPTTHLHPPQFQREFCKAYLEKLSLLDEWGRDVTSNDVERLYLQLRKMSFYVVLYSIGACVIMAQAPIKEGADLLPIDWLKAGVRKWKWYLECKDEVLSLAVPPVETSRLE